MNRGLVVKIVVIVIVTAILGEFSINPFETSFRFGLGGAGFFLLLLLNKDIPYRITGFITGVFTTIFRVALDFFRLDSFSIMESFIENSPIIGYYVTFALLLYLFKESRILKKPLWLGVYGAFCDSMSNMIELSIISIFIGSNVFLAVEINYVLGVAIIRSFFVVGLFTMFQTNKLHAVYKEQQSRFEQVQYILSELYIEVFYLKKTLSEIEDVTAKGHRLYRDLKGNSETDERARLALSLTQELHEVKKDNQRILAGLEKVIHHENEIVPLSLEDIFNLAIKSNQKYSRFHRKNIEFDLTLDSNVKVNFIYPMLIIINNLLSNAVEAADHEGRIKVSSTIKEKNVIIQIEDNGSGISDEEIDVIFEPGYTTKFDETGKASSGIGLSHVKSMVSELGGMICVNSNGHITTFIVTLPIDNI